MDTLLDYVESAKLDNRLMSLKLGGNRITRVDRLASLLKQGAHSI